MADEAPQGPQDAYDFAAKITQSDGLFPAKAGGAMANCAEVAFCGGTMLEAAVGTIASAHLFATLPSLAFGTELFGPLPSPKRLCKGLRRTAISV